MHFYLLLAALALGSPSESTSPVAAEPHGRYVEARTASVFAGACHYGSEATTQGREALLVWSFDGGAHAGVDLAGVDVACAIAAERNLAEPAEPAQPPESVAEKDARRTLLYVSDGASREQADAALALLRERHPELLARAEPARSVALTARFDGDAYSVEAPGLFALRGEALPDRACCKMPQAVWYVPLAPITSALVGHNTLFRFSDKTLGESWSRTDENTSFTGSFRFPAAARSAR